MTCLLFPLALDQSVFPLIPASTRWCLPQNICCNRRKKERWRWPPKNCCKRRKKERKKEENAFELPGLHFRLKKQRDPLFETASKHVAVARWSCWARLGAPNPGGELEISCPSPEAERVRDKDKKSW